MLCNIKKCRNIIKECAKAFRGNGEGSRCSWQNLKWLNKEEQRMKNLKLGKKFLLAFGIIVVTFLVAICSAGYGIIKSKKSYANFYKKEYEAITRVYEIQLDLRKALNELSLSVIESDPGETAKRITNVTKNIEGLESQLQWIYNNYEGDVSGLKEFENYMNNNKEIRLRAMEYASLDTIEGNQMAQQIILEEYNPVVDQYITILESAFKDMETASNTQYEESVLMMDSLLWSAIGICVIAFIITIAVAMKLTKDILTPVKLIEHAMDEVSKGNLSVKIDYESGDEFGDMANYMYKVTSGVERIIKDIQTILSGMAQGDFAARSSDRSMYIGDYHAIIQAMIDIKSSLNRTMTTLNQSAEQVSSGSDQVSSGAQALSQGATEQASSVEELAASINDISTRINANAEGAQEASKKSAMVGEVAGESNRRMQDMLAAMADINTCSGEIGKIIKTIEDIAFQTNILALNAAVEAARAGAAGKGFAVVADEVRNLASKSAEASKNTAVLIENSLTAVENGKKIADETASSLEHVMTGIHEAAAMMDAIAKASTEQAQAISQITVGIDQISSVVQTNSATSEESAAASEELSSQAQIMKDLVRKFKLDSDMDGMSTVQQYAPQGEFEYGTSTVGQISYPDDGKY